MASASKQPQDDLELKQLTQAELARLERQYRVMEGDRSSYMTDMHVYLAQQRKIIDVLTKRKQNLMSDASLPVSKMVAERECQLVKKITKDLTLFEGLNGKIKTEKTQIRELKIQINKVKDEILKLNKTDVNELRVQEKKEEYKRMIVALEDRLEVATRKLNAVTADNAVYRGEINHLLFERKTFHRFYVQLSKQVMQSKQVMLDLIEQATTAFDQREETQEKLKGLKERMKAERVLHAQEVRELVRKLENDEVLYEFLSVKGQKRVLADLEAKEALQKKMEVEAIEEKVRKYNEMLDKIKNFSGETDIGRLAARFLKQEEENFTLFNYVNELNSELEALQEHVNELMLNIDEQRSINRERAAKEQETLTVLYGNLEREKWKNEQAERELGHLEGVLDELMAGIERMFYRCRCDSAPVLALVGDNPRVNIYNVMLCIAVLRKAVECIVEGD